MKLTLAIQYYKDFHVDSLKESTKRSYLYTITNFLSYFQHIDIEEIKTDQCIIFLKRITNNCKKTTKRNRFAILNSFFNYIISSYLPDLKNPCESKIARQLFRNPKRKTWQSIDKELIDEMIFRTTELGDRLILELMARAGMRVGEVLQIRPIDINGQKIKVTGPKSGKDNETVYLPRKVADRLNLYIQHINKANNERIFDISYSTAWRKVKAAGKLLGINIAPHDLRRFCATHASRVGVPLEIISKTILRHSDLATTQAYLGNVNEDEAIRFIDRMAE